MQSPRFAFISSNPGWGGSEELWSAAAVKLAESGHAITVIKPDLGSSPRIERLRSLGCRLVDLKRMPLGLRSIYAFLANCAWLFVALVQVLRLKNALRVAKADFVVVSQGGNMDGLFHLKRVRRRGDPYGIICQKAAEMYWPTDSILDELREAYRDARFVWFVSDHNRRLTEEQLAMALPNASVVRNPFAVSWDSPPEWPAEDVLHLACVGRLFPREKGQDIILRVLARDKWRARPLKLSFYGSGDHRRGLEETARYLGLDNVSFPGFSADIDRLWSDHHALLLPSHCEGLPLVVVEAMLSARIPIVTRVAGNPEVVEDGRTGFLAEAPTDDAVDAALERAWQARAQWRDMGLAARASIQTLVPRDPAAEAARLILEAAQG